MTWTNTTQLKDNLPALLNALGEPLGVPSGTDDTTVFQTAVASDRTILVPPGTWYLNNLTLTGLSNVRFVGAGPGAIIRPISANGFMMTLENCTDFVFENIAFDNRAVTAFGGIRVYGQTRMRVQGCKFFDSDVQAGGSSDRYAMVFSSLTGAVVNTDIIFVDNDVRDLQVEFDYIQGLQCSGNISRNAKKTAAFGIFTTTGAASTVKDVVMERNIVIDPDVSQGAFCAVLDPADSNNWTFRNVRISDNTVIYTVSTPKPAVKFGTNSTVTASSGNVFEDIEIARNRILYLGGGTPSFIIYNANSATSNITERRFVVKDNYVYGNGAGSEYAVRIDLVTDVQIEGNTIHNVPFGIAEVSCTDARIALNRVEALTTDYSAAGPIIEFDSAGDLQWGPAGVNRFRLVDDGNFAYVQTTRSVKFTDIGSGTSRLTIGTDGSIADLDLIQLVETTEPANGPADTGRLFVKDNGSGKTQLCVRFASGATIVLATEV